MKIRISNSFSKRLQKQIEFIAHDNPGAARKFKTDILKKIGKIPEMPYAHRKSIFFDRDNIRDLIFKGYVIVYKIDTTNSLIIVFGFNKYKKDIFS